MNRRLPVYLLIDCSESMIGSGIASVRAGLSTMLSSLRRDPHALDTVYLSVITFDADARVAVPMTSLLDFQQPALSIKPGTSLGAALALLADRIELEVQKTVHQAKGDYRPLVLLLTDGQPSDDWLKPLARIGTKVRPHPANIYAIGCGEDVDFSVLQSITDVVLRMDDMGAESFGKLFVWLTASIATASQGIGETADGQIKLEKLPSNVKAVTEKVPPLPEGLPRQVFIRAQCSSKRFSYLMRYRLNALLGCYHPVQSHRLSAEEAEIASLELPDIPNRLLNGAPFCPWCDSSEAGVCNICRTVFCFQTPAHSVECPSCRQRLKMNEGHGNDGFNIRQSGG